MSRFGPKLAGAGGFINISQSAKAVVFAGTFTAGPLAVEVGDGRLAIKREGDVRKFVAEVEHRTFSGEHALKRGQSVLYVTERCVFRLIEAGLELVEVAPGIDIERDILAHMDFVPAVGDPSPMDARIFAAGAMGLRDRLSGLRLERRLSYDPVLRMLFIDLRDLAIAEQRDIERIKAEVEGRVRRLGHKVYAIVNTRGLSIDPGVRDSFRRTFAGLEASCCLGVTRYGAAGPLGPQASGETVAPLPTGCSGRCAGQVMASVRVGARGRVRWLSDTSEPKGTARHPGHGIPGRCERHASSAPNRDDGAGSIRCTRSRIVSAAPRLPGWLPRGFGGRGELTAPARAGTGGTAA